MLYEFSKEIAKLLKPWPIHVFFGEERFDKHPVVGENKLKIEHIGQEKWRTARVAQSGPERVIATREIGVKVTLVARSTKGGAAREDHQRKAEELLAAFWFALVLIGHGKRNPLVGHEADGGYVKSTDPVEIGCRYEMTFRLEKSEFQPTLPSVDGASLVPQGSVRETSSSPPEPVC